MNITDVVSDYVALKKSGSYYKGLSPFTQEKTPSFFVYPDKGFYYCFSTSQGGDIFKFIQVKENLSFREAVEFLANKFNIELQYEDSPFGSAPSYKRQLYEIHDVAADWYSKQFFADTPQSEEIRKYWVGERGFTLEEARELQIGFAPVNSDGLKKLLAARKYAPNAIAGSGIFGAREGETDIRNFYPRFRGRIMIPICDIQGRVIAFTARKTRWTPNTAAEEGKYVNSRDTDIFNKKLVVFNLHRAKNEAAEKKYFIIVEGQLDAVRMWCSGFKNTVATEGTAATQEHFAQLKRHAQKAVLLFDGDQAGQKAIMRAIPKCFAAGIEPFAAVLPENEDPDSFIKKFGADAMRKLVEEGKLPAIDFAAKFLMAQCGQNPSPQDRFGVITKLFETVANCQSQVLIDDYLAQIAGALGTGIPPLKNDYTKWLKGAKLAPATPTPAQIRNAEASAREASKRAEIAKAGGINRQGMLTNAVYDALMVALHYENVAEGLSKIVDEAWLESDAVECRVLKKVLAMFREGIGFSVGAVDENFEAEDEKNLIYRIMSIDDSAIENPVKCANQSLEEMHKNYISQRIKALNAELENAEGMDFAHKMEILKRINALRTEATRLPAKIDGSF